MELSLNRELTRNDRRAGWGRNSPVFCYTRWIQEPMAIEVLAGSVGEMLIDQVELIARGEGRPYPVFEAGQILLCDRDYVGDQWTGKLKDDLRAEKADLAVLVTTTLPKDVPMAGRSSSTAPAGRLCRSRTTTWCWSSPTKSRPAIPGKSPTARRSIWA